MYAQGILLLNFKHQVITQVQRMSATHIPTVNNRTGLCTLRKYSFFL